MAQAEELKPQFNDKIGLASFTAFNLAALESNSQLLHIELIGWIDEKGIIINPCYLLCATPCLLEKLHKYITHQHLLLILQGVLSDIESRQQNLPRPRLLYRDKVSLW